MQTRIAAERVMTVPADAIYHCIADYRDHHRPGGFLPPAFTDFVIERGGVGAGTQLHWVVNAGGRRRMVSATISEPEPGRTLVETAPDLETVFTVDPVADGARVRFETTIADGGVQGILTRLFAGRILRPLYADELARLEEYARAHASTTTPTATPPEAVGSPRPQPVAARG